MTDRENMVFIVGDTIVRQMRRCNSLWISDNSRSAMRAESKLEGIQKLAVNLGLEVDFGYNNSFNDVLLYLWVDVEGVRFTVPDERGDYGA